MSGPTASTSARQSRNPIALVVVLVPESRRSVEDEEFVRARKIHAPRREKCWRAVGTARSVVPAPSGRRTACAKGRATKTSSRRPVPPAERGRGHRSAASLPQSACEIVRLGRVIASGTCRSPCPLPAPVQTRPVQRAGRGMKGARESYAMSAFPLTTDERPQTKLHFEPHRANSYTGDAWPRILFRPSKNFRLKRRGC